MLTRRSGFNHDDRWGHRASEPNKAVIASIALARLRTDIQGNANLANNNTVGMAQKLLLFWRKPARRCWWEGVELENVEGVNGKLKVWIRRVWTLEMVGVDSSFTRTWGRVPRRLKLNLVTKQLKKLTLGTKRRKNVHQREEDGEEEKERFPKRLKITFRNDPANYPTPSPTPVPAPLPLAPVPAPVPAPMPNPNQRIRIRVDSPCTMRNR